MARWTSYNGGVGDGVKVKRAKRVITIGIARIPHKGQKKQPKSQRRVLKILAV
jgi:hypothetical protein